MKRSILDCNGKNACGDSNFMAAVCSKTPCVRPTSVDSCSENLSHGAVVEAPYVSWNHILKQGYWCLPTCILEDNIHSKMAVISSLSSQRAMCKQYASHGRCGIDFHP